MVLLMPVESLSHVCSAKRNSVLVSYDGGTGIGLPCSPQLKSSALMGSRRFGSARLSSRRVSTTGRSPLAGFSSTGSLGESTSGEVGRGVFGDSKPSFRYPVASISPLRPIAWFCPRFTMFKCSSHFDGVRPE
jgi:hypothetical protein